MAENKTQNEDSFSNFNIDNYLFIKPEEIKTAILKWLATRQAQKRYSKPVDAIFVGKNGTYSYAASKLVSDLFDSQLIDQQILYLIEEKLSYNNGMINNAEAAILIDYDGDGPIITLAGEIVSKIKYKNRVVEIQILVDKFEGSDNISYYVTETRNKDEIRREIGKKENGEIIAISDTKKLPKEILDAFDGYDLGSEKWLGDFEPFVFYENNPNGESDRIYIERELDDLIVVAQKKRDDILYSSTKVITSAVGNNNRQKENGNSEAAAAKAAKKMAASAIISRESYTLEGTPASVIATAIPNTDTYDRAERTILNTILKKTGGATDVDSKGTVQQSKSEVLMSQGDEYKVSNWKRTDRQMRLKELLVKIKKTYTQILKITKPFKDVEFIFGLISQEEVLSETEQLANAEKALQLGISSKLLIQARYHNLKLIDMYEFKRLNFGGDTDG